jgi:hypothetical protein
MFEPNGFTMQAGSNNYGIHTFKGSTDVMLCVQHPCGDWITIRNAKKDEIEEFVAKGIKAVPKPRAAKVESAEAEG